MERGANGDRDDHGRQHRRPSADPRRWHIAVFLAPAVLVYTAIMIIPLADDAAAFLLFTPSTGSSAFVGFDNFRTVLFFDERWSVSFWNALRNNVFFFIIHMLLQNPIGIALAALLSVPVLRGRAFYRTAIFLPTMLSFVIVGFTWKLIISPLWGVTPNLMGAVGLKWLFGPWLGQESTALTTLSLISVWQYVGIPMMLIYAALLSIPDEVIEAAECRRRHRVRAVPEDQAAADPALHRHHLDPDLRRQFQRLRPDLHGAGRAGRAEFLGRSSSAPSSTAPSSAFSSSWATRTWAPPSRR